MRRFPAARSASLRAADRGATSLRRLVAVLGLALLAPAAHAAPQRIVTAGSAVTEIVYALGLGDQVVAVDASSRHPEDARNKPSVGYVRTLGAEGILSQSPDLVLLAEEAGPPVVIEQLRQSGVRVEIINGGRSLDSVGDKIRQIARAAECEPAGEALVRRVSESVGKLRSRVAATGEERPAVIFLHARGGGSTMAAGRDTAAHAMIEACGGHNACGDFTGYKPLTPEALVTLAPEFIIVSDSIPGDDSQLASLIPGLGQTPAARKAQLIRVDDAAFLGFGPRSAEAATQVAARLRTP